MARRNGQGPRQLQDVTEKFRKGELRLLRLLEEEGLISRKETEGMINRVTQAATQKRASEVLSTASSVHSKIIQALRKGKLPAAERDRTELDLLQEITRLTQTWVDREQLFENLLDLLRQAIPYEDATLFLVNREAKQLTVGASRGEPCDLIDGVKFDFGSGFSSWVAKEQKPVLLTELNRGRRPGRPEVGSFLSVPLIVQGELIGVLNMSHPRTRSFTEEHLRMAVLVAGQVAGAIQRLLMYEEMSRLATTDELTGLHNRRHFLERLQDEIDRARRYDLRFSVLMLDIDNFKAINDLLGHGVGDRVLADFGKLLRRNARSCDLPVRYGGEEFIILMPMTDNSHGGEAAERVRQAIAGHTFPRRKKLTASIGVASYPEDGTSAHEILRRVDAALYLAKRTGRNKSVVHPKAA